MGFKICLTSPPAILEGLLDPSLLTDTTFVHMTSKSLVETDLILIKKLLGYRRYRQNLIIKDCDTILEFFHYFSFQLSRI